MYAAHKMRARLTAVAVATLTALSVGIIAPVQSASAATLVPITGAGSTWAYPAIHAWSANLSQLGLVSDTRNTFPGWSVSGQAADFAGSGSAAGASISGNQLGWAPTGTSLGTCVTLGGTVAPAAAGLGTTPAVLASAHAGCGYGTSTLGANLTLDIPPTAATGQYAGSLTINAVTTLP